MDFKFFLEWDEESGLLLSKLYPLVDSIESFFNKKSYGTSVTQVWIVLTARGNDFKQRKRYKKQEARFEYDILLDYFLIKNVPLEEKKNIIRRQIVEISEQTFSKYNFEDFNKDAFLADLKEIVSHVEW